MDKYDLLEAMSGIRDEYVKDASVVNEASYVSETSYANEAPNIKDASYIKEVSGPSAESGSGQEKQEVLSARPASPGRRRPGAAFWAAAAAAVLCISVVLPNLSPGASSAFQELPLFGNYFRLVTIRSYENQSESADAYAEESTLVTMSKESSADRGGVPSGTMAAGSIEADEAAKSRQTEEKAAGAGEADNGMKTFSEQAEEIPAEEVGAEENETEENAEEDFAADEIEAMGAEAIDVEEEDSAAEETEAVGAEAVGAEAEDSAAEEIETVGAEAVGAETEDSAAEDLAEEDFGETSENWAEELEDSAAVSVRAVLSAAQITEEVRQKEEQAVTGFEQNVSQETGYHTLRFLHRTITDTEDWYCMEVLCYTASADGFEQVNHFTINKNTGNRIELEDLFRDGADYITPISEEIISQMRAQMKENPDVEYWIDSAEGQEFDFSRIHEDQDFYIDDTGKLVICFNELEAAPMSMGTVEFTIPDEVLDSIRVQ